MEVNTETNARIKVDSFGKTQKNSFNGYSQLTKAGLTEIIREPKLMFFILVFPLIFLLFFGVMGKMVPASESMGLEFFEFMFPGLLIFALMSIGLLGTSTPIVEMRQKGILRMFELSPLSKTTFILAQISIRYLLSVIQITLFMILGLLFGFISLNNLVPIILLSLLGVGLMLTLGFFFGSVFKSSEVTSGVLAGVSAPLLMLSGVLLPFTLLPDIIEKIAMFIPFTYLGDAMRQIFFPDLPGEYSLMTDILVIIGFTVVVYFISVKTFKWNLDKN
ncbi:ABC transporter permease [Mesobacillus subterraneus]|uniref:ABC transporter permease n=1 Tax=Mesobacillus subterraneus TaxID=285983 RepID=UPI001CFD8625|nr:ABC transporter permease [Mesobacillus subterraneus]WLR54580.1 ABC transporter permease [Mesobacillus subterraneus]